MCLPGAGFGAEVGPRQSDCGPANITTSAFTLSMKSSAGGRAHDHENTGSRDGERLNTSGLRACCSSLASTASVDPTPIDDLSYLTIVLSDSLKDQQNRAFQIRHSAKHRRLDHSTHVLHRQPGARSRRRKLYEEVAARIEEMIHAGRFTPGDQLPSEKDIMEELGVGRSTVREAMLSLRKMGLVTVRSGERARVTTPTPNVLVNELSGAARLLLAQEGGIGQFQEARMLFEVGLARLAAQQATEEDVEHLSRCSRGEPPLDRGS